MCGFGTYVRCKFGMQESIRLLYDAKENSPSAKTSFLGVVTRWPIANQSQCSIINILYEQYFIWPVTAD